MLNPRQTIGTQLLEKMANPNLKQLSFILETVGLTPASRFIDAYSFNLSGGQIQRVLIALAIINDPVLILADEPFSAVDAELKEELAQLLVHITKERQSSLLLVSHNLELVSAIANRIFRIEGGSIINNSETDLELKSNVNLYESVGTDTDILLEVNGLYKSYTKSSLFTLRRKAIPVLSNFSLILKHKEILGIMGPSGIGKSTLARMIAGTESIDGGSVLFKGNSVSEMDKDARREYFKSVQLIPQDPLSMMPPHRPMKALFEDVYFIKRQTYNSEQISNLLNSLGIEESLLIRLPSELSGGQRQRILIGRALLMEVDLLICDEIFSSLDSKTEADIRNLLFCLCAYKGLSIIMISHDKSSLDKLCHRVINM